MDINQPTDEEMLARVLHRDGLMLVIDKPAGIPVHKGPKGGPNLEASFDALRFGLPRAPVLAHRLDKETSGCLVLGRHRKATASLGLLFKHSKISKTYWAVVEGGPEADEGIIELPLGKLNAERGWWQKPDPQGQPAMTRWRVLGRSYSPATPPPDSAFTSGTNSPPPCGAKTSGARSEGSGVGVPTGSLARSHPPPQPSPTRGEGAQGGGGDIETPPTRSTRLTWLAMEPVTGRTHQLRVHSAASGWPIVGDNIYGNGPRFGEPRLHLHAREISIPLSKNKPPVHVVAPAPAHMHERLRMCGWNGE
ncbi:putative RNA pseudouridine synthase [Bradyrhizobium oligotrophicum S58]|uniref:Putative RNA pseudouridine synthase n=1 Tax=Bradyrhizobium oligotrophicum S58 TaxID=1245469 RepID=M4Z0I5_9BRAD|nr:RNA pseudouridine synthase [Bradyrhizobium oligotrophicum]BAM86409.1 putative RNA pseudouridine synthase [Bradyrhizobium oligotrophicum S58]